MQLTKQDLEKLPHKFQTMFAVFCAKQVFHLISEKDKNVYLKAIEAAEGFIEGTVSKDAANAAANAASAAYTAAYAAANAANAAGSAAYTAAYAAAIAAYTAAYAAANAAYAAANAANKEQIIKEQWEYYNELLNFEKNFEEIILGDLCLKIL